MFITFKHTKNIKTKKAHKIRAKRQLCVYTIHTVALIRTLAINPDILLLDEPFSALDYQTRLSVANDVYNIIKKEKKLVIMITHDIAEAISLSDRVVVLSNRPANVKKVVNITLNKKKSPLERRSEDGFNNYYESIWKLIDKN